MDQPDWAGQGLGPAKSQATSPGPGGLGGPRPRRPRPGRPRRSEELNSPRSEELYSPSPPCSMASSSLAKSMTSGIVGEEA